MIDTIDFKWLALFSLFFCLSGPVNAIPDFTDDARRLLFDIDGKTIEISVPALVAKYPPKLVSVFDIDFGERRSYWAISWADLLSSVNVAVDTLKQFEQISFVCIDGYKVNSTIDVFFSDKVTPWLALASADADGSDSIDEGRWRAFKIENKEIGFDPFYLVWQGNSEHEVKHLPWPYQLSEIKFFKNNEYVGLKPKIFSERLNAGYDLYLNHCIRCHRIGEVGGVLGPDLIYERHELFALDDQILATMIQNIRMYKPETKMPDYSSSFNASQIQSTIQYMRYVYEAAWLE